MDIIHFNDEKIKKLNKRNILGIRKFYFKILSLHQDNLKQYDFLNYKYEMLLEYIKILKIYIKLKDRKNYLNYCFIILDFMKNKFDFDFFLKCSITLKNFFDEIQDYNISIKICKNITKVLEEKYIFLKKSCFNSLPNVFLNDYEIEIIRMKNIYLNEILNYSKILNHKLDMINCLIELILNDVKININNLKCKENFKNNDLIFKKEEYCEKNPFNKTFEYFEQLRLVIINNLIINNKNYSEYFLCEIILCLYIKKYKECFDLLSKNIELNLLTNLHSKIFYDIINILYKDFENKNMNISSLIEDPTKKFENKFENECTKDVIKESTSENIKIYDNDFEKNLTKGHSEQKNKINEIVSLINKSFFQNKNYKSLSIILLNGIILSL